MTARFTLAEMDRAAKVAAARKLAVTITSPDGATCRFEPVLDNKQETLKPATPKKWSAG